MLPLASRVYSSKPTSIERAQREEGIPLAELSPCLFCHEANTLFLRLITSLQQCFRL